MPSSKKQRGKQRKATAAAADTKLLLLAAPTSKQMWMGLRQGDNDITRNVAAVIATGHSDALGRDALKCVKRFRQRLLEEGIIQLVLDFLIQCENSEVRCVISNTATPLLDPSRWLNLLVNITIGNAQVSPLDDWEEDSENRKIVMHIVRDFGPVVKCMCNTPGEFFKKKKHWYQSAMPFVFLVMNIAGTRDALPILLQYEGLIEFMVQSIYWESHRPDIVEESSRFHTIDFQFIADNARKFISRISNLDVCREDVPDNSVRRCLKAIGTSRIAARSATPVAGRRSELYVMNLIAHIQSEHLGKERNSELRYIDYNFSFRTLKSLIIAGCVDKDVIAGVIDLAKQKQLTCEDAPHITMTMNAMFVPQYNEKLYNEMGNSDRARYDNVFAYAIDKGLIEVCLRLLVMFKDDARKSKVEKHLLDLSRFALNISMSMKSSKAFLRQLSQTTKMLQDAEAKLEGCSQQCQRIFWTLKMTMHLKDGIEHYATSKTCRCCGKVIIKDEIKQCGLCMNAVYCSRMCQEEDWECGDGLGHGSCCQDRHLNALEKNIHDVVNKLVADNDQNFLAQATLTGFDILDCVVLINLKIPTITLALPEDARCFLSLPESCDSFKKTFDHNRSSGYMTSMCCFYSCRVKSDDSVVIMKHKLKNENDSWQAAHARVKSEHQLFEIGRDRRARESLGPFFCDWYERYYLRLLLKSNKEIGW